jgi:hypothetical protein
VRSQCADDPHLLRIVTELLANHSLQSAFAEHRGQPSEFRESGEADEAEPVDKDEFVDLQPGTRIGPYTILDRLGRGGMGQVFLCNDRELGRKVALKCLLSSRQDIDRDRNRILREAKAAASIDHPNIASVHHVVEHGDRAFIVMEYVHGENLAATLARGRLPMARVVEIGRELASALSAAHARGVIHRDLKPANVQMRFGGGAKVLDFGVARAALGSSRISSTATTGFPALGPTFSVAHGGTLPYMAPEQLLGQPADERSDIYSLGVVLFEMATGRRPFRAESVLALITEQADGAPSARSLDPAIPRALDDVIARALAVDVAQRYQSAADVESALERVAGRAVPAAAANPVQRIAKVAAAGVGIAAAAALVIFAFGYLTSREFNYVLGRDGPFAAFGQESAGDYFYYGTRSLFGPTAILLVSGAALTALLFVGRMLTLIPPLGRLVRVLRRESIAIHDRLDLGEPAVLAQALATLSIVAILAVSAAFQSFVTAWRYNINTSPESVFEPLALESPTRVFYQVTLTLLVALLSAGLYRVLQLRRRHASVQGRGPIAALCAGILVLVLMLQLPFRILWRADFERVDLGPLKCYNIGASDDTMLVYCPQASPPRNRVVSGADPSLRRLGYVDNIFHR